MRTVGALEEEADYTTRCFGTRFEDVLIFTAIPMPSCTHECAPTRIVQRAEDALECRGNGFAGRTDYRLMPSNAPHYFFRGGDCQLTCVIIHSSRYLASSR